MNQQIVRRDQAAHAVAEHEERLAPLLLLHPYAEGMKIGDEFGEAPDVSPRPLGSAMSAMVESVDRKTERYEPLDQVAVATAVLPVAMSDDDGGVNVSFG
jgi:hypothetical protein